MVTTREKWQEKIADALGIPPAENVLTDDEISDMLEQHEKATEHEKTFPDWRR